MASTITSSVTSTASTLSHRAEITEIDEPRQKQIVAMSTTLSSTTRSAEIQPQGELVVPISQYIAMREQQATQELKRIVATALVNEKLPISAHKRFEMAFRDKWHELCSLSDYEKLIALESIKVRYEGAIPQKK